jgi:hypothetical protein
MRSPHSPSVGYVYVVCGVCMSVLWPSLSYCYAGGNVYIWYAVRVCVYVECVYVCGVFYVGVVPAHGGG